ncbi:helix-turn-helix transcriptional regulator [Ferruginibacter sp. HRS2-29]|uniref:helix-turn-helix domain-containing protein n=1 Tax=Ferruginibacter sp. HRS2-29 TaxID=2487334 RepID=UPI0020CFCAEF|nr:helix-turn-helix transcriptional regulator [Ferruginibacter sp. HRS2-29]MCP9752800.1 XRE family transcriptional regulator [Ferruginibacter sp. HRS2-29]
MSTLREFRKKAMLSQSTMAEMLKTTRSQINMAERGERPLPAHAVERLEEFLKISAIGGKMPIEEQLRIIESELMLGFEAKSIWEAMLSKNTWQQHCLRQQLRKMQLDFEATLRKSRGIWQAVQSLPAVNGAPVEIDYLDDIQQTIQRKLLTCGRIAQLRLQLSIDLLLAEASLLNQYLNPATAAKEKPM